MIELSHLLVVEARNHSSMMQFVLDQSKNFQALERLAHWSPTNSKPCGQFAFAEPRPRRQRSVFNRLQKQFVSFGTG